jgi:hypothetical protein
MTDFENKRPSKIIGIQFSILGPHEIHILIINQYYVDYLIHGWGF